MLVPVYTCQNATLFEITCHSSFVLATSLKHLICLLNKLKFLLHTDDLSDGLVIFTIFNTKHEVDTCYRKGYFYWVGKFQQIFLCR